MGLLLRLKPAEALTIAFLLLLMALSLIFQKRALHVERLMLAYGLLLALQVLLIKDLDLFRKNRTMEVVRNIVFPVICVLVIFDSLGHLVHAVNPKDIDPWLIRLDYLMFNGYPTVMLESIHSPLLTDVLQIAYTSYYFLPIALGLLLFRRGREREFSKVLFLILLCFYLSYVGYLLFPALGPRYAMNHLQSFELEGLFVAGPVQVLLNDLEGIKRDAFPSGHTGIVLIVSCLSFKYQRGFFYATIPIVVLLIFATVYCRYHYVIDVAGGIVLAVITFFVGERYYGYWETRNSLNH